MPVSSGSAPPLCLARSVPVSSPVAEAWLHTSHIPIDAIDGWGRRGLEGS